MCLSKDPDISKSTNFELREEHTRQFLRLVPSHSGCYIRKSCRLYVTTF